MPALHVRGAVAAMAIIALAGCGGGARKHTATRARHPPAATTTPVATGGPATPATSTTPSTSTTPPAAAPSLPPPARSVRSVLGLLYGLPQRGQLLGQPHARVTVTIYSDLECPVCRELMLSRAFTQFLYGYVRTGRVKLVDRGFQTATQDTAVFRRQQSAALAAGRQRRLWQFVLLFLDHQGPEGSGYDTGTFLAELAAEVPGLKFARWQHDRARPDVSAQVIHDESVATALGINGTPTLIFSGPKGRRTGSGAVPGYGALAADVRAVS